MIDDKHAYITLYCGHCGRPLKVKLGCGHRTCPACRRKWFGYHFKALLVVISTWKVVHSLTLTVKNIPDIEFDKRSVRLIRNNFSALLKSFPAIAGGFYIVQATNFGRGWHLHLHVLFDGSFIPKDVISRAWKEITGDSFIVHLRDVPNPSQAVRYLLSDFSGAPRIRPEDYETYDGVFRGSRLVQPFGKYRSVKLRVPYPCPYCGCDCWLYLDNLFDREPKRMFCARGS